MVNRRNFLKIFSAAGVTLPAFGSASLASAKKNNPVILCSRGDYWGRKVLKPGWDILSSNSSILDAIEKSANVTELDEEDSSVGYGGLPNERGIVQLDASIMYGPTHNCGSVAALEGIKTPSSVARLVMERTDHIHLVGKGAQEFAVYHGFKLENLLTEKKLSTFIGSVGEREIYKHAAAVGLTVFQMPPTQATKTAAKEVSKIGMELLEALNEQTERSTEII